MQPIYPLFVFLFLAAAGLSAQADNYGPVEWDVLRLGYAVPAGKTLSSGVSLGSEVRYNATDNISAGLRFDLALFGAADDVEGIDIGAFGSYAVMGDYYFSSESNVRPFAGIGLGLFSGGSISIDNGNTVDEADAGSAIGLIPRVGVELGHLRVNLEYNVPFKKGFDNYIGINIAPTIGGGRQ